ncbi:MAG: PAS domain-containing sensor histidine kinase, partial [Rhodobacteraceae bacterium]|nr:PAS domain-containing sensor histidine kinase [Paracoccaceae bacterium]
MTKISALSTQDVQSSYLSLDVVQTILDNSGVGLFNVDLRTGVSVVSSTWKTMIGMDPNSSRPPQAEWLKRVHPDDLEKVKEADAALLAGQVDKSKTVFRFRHMEERWIWIQSDAAIVEWTSTGEPARLAGTHTDVTAEMVAKEIAEIRNSEKQLILERSPASTAMFSLDGMLLYCNQVFCDFVGYSSAELSGMPYYRLAKFDSDPVVVGKLLALQADELSEFEFECKFLRKDGSFRTALVSACRTEDQTGHVKLLFQSIDISERIELEHQKDQFLATVSHELRTPLTAILGALAMLEGGSLGEFDDSVLRVVKLANKSADRMNSLVSDLLDLQALQSGEVTYDLLPIDCESLLEEMGQIAQPMLREDQSLVFDVEGGPDLHVKADVKGIVQILENLLSNAIKFSPRDGKIEVTAKQDVSDVVLEVADNGTGVP